MLIYGASRSFLEIVLVVVIFFVCVQGVGWGWLQWCGGPCDTRQDGDHHHGHQDPERARREGQEVIFKSELFNFSKSISNCYFWMPLFLLWTGCFWPGMKENWSRDNMHKIWALMRTLIYISVNGKCLSINPFRPLLLGNICISLNIRDEDPEFFSTDPDPAQLKKKIRIRLRIRPEIEMKKKIFLYFR